MDSQAMGRSFVADRARRIGRFRQRCATAAGALVPGAWLLAPALLLVSCVSYRPIAENDEVDEGPEYAEPIVIEETYPNEPGEYDLRLSLERKLQDEDGERAVLWALPRAQFFFGITDRLGGEVAVSLLRREPSDDSATVGASNVELSAKYLLHENLEGRSATVLGMELELPNGDDDRELGDGKFEVAPFLAYLKDFPTDHPTVRHLLFQGNIGVHHTHGTREEDEAFYNLSLGVPLDPSDTLIFFLEAFGSVGLHPSEGRETPMYVSPGLKFNFDEESFLSLGFPSSPWIKSLEARHQIAENSRSDLAEMTRWRWATDERSDSRSCSFRRASWRRVPVTLSMSG